jgi:hypothetical protein
MSNFPFTPVKVGNFCRDCDVCCWVVSRPDLFNGITSDKWEDRLCFIGKGEANRFANIVLLNGGGTVSPGPDNLTKECTGQCSGFWQNANYDGGYSNRFIISAGCNSGYKCPEIPRPPEPATEDQWAVREGNTKRTEIIFYPCIRDN